MKIFTENRVDTNTLKSDKAEVKTSKGSPRKKMKVATEKKNVSSDEIRQKLADHVELSNSGKKATSAKFQQKLGDGFLNENKVATIQKVPEAKTKEIESEEKNDDPNPPGHLLKSDVGSNDPSAEGTTKKLKTVLEKGAFNFNPKEREVLDRILSER